METTQETQQPAPGTASETPPKKRPGRPKGSKNQKTLERERRAATKAKRQAKKQAAAEPELPPEDPATPVDDPLAVPVKPPDVPVEADPPTQDDEDDDAPADSLGEDEADLALEMLFGLYNSMTPMPVWLLIRKKVERLDQADAQAVWETCSEIAKLTEDEKVVLKRALKPRVAAIKLSEDERLLWTCGMIVASKVAAIMMATDPAIAAQYGAVLQASRTTS